jgi:branched-chain amino acid transport system substrate-binding protein
MRLVLASFRKTLSSGRSFINWCHVRVGGHPIKSINKRDPRLRGDDGCHGWLLLALLLLTAAPAYADITIAAVGPFTGQEASTGEQLQRGVAAAVAAINESGGVLGQKLRVTYKDDVCDPKQAVAIANKLSGENVVAVVGHVCSGSAIPASKVYNEEGIVLISPAATNTTLTQQGFDNIFRVCGRDDQQGVVIADFLKQHHATTSLAIVHDKSAYGQGLADEVKKSLAVRGMQEKLYESISRGERDFGALIARLKDNNIGVLFFGGYFTEAGLLMRQMRERGLTTILISGDGLTSTEYWSITGTAGEGTLMSFNPDPRKRLEAAEAVKRLRASGYDPEGVTLYSYAAVEVLADAIKKAGSADSAKIAAALRGGSFKSVIGDLTFDQKGDITRPDYIIYRWTKGNYEPVQ